MIQKVLAWSLIVAALIELVTVVFRFGLHREANRDARWLSRVTHGYRVHHGYVGVLFILLGLGTGLLLSDLLHHFVVLWLLTRKHELSLRYPRKGQRINGTLKKRWCGQHGEKGVY